MEFSLYGLQPEEIAYDHGIKRDEVAGQKAKIMRYSKKIPLKDKDYLFLKSFRVLCGEMLCCYPTDS